MFCLLIFISHGLTEGKLLQASCVEVSKIILVGGIGKESRLASFASPCPTLKSTHPLCLSLNQGLQP